jgi:hypothetical protein
MRVNPFFCSKHDLHLFRCTSSSCDLFPVRDTCIAKTRLWEWHSSDRKAHLRGSRSFPVLFSCLRTQLV